VKSLFNKDGGVSTIAYLAEISVGMVFVVHVNAPTCMDCVLFLYQVSPNVLCMIDLIANVDHLSVFLFSEPSVSVVV
jgi:hypothetical protein